MSVDWIKPGVAVLPNVVSATNVANNNQFFLILKWVTLCIFLIQPVNIVIPVYLKVTIIELPHFC